MKTTKSQSTFGPFDEHGRFIGGVHKEVSINACKHPCAHAGVCQICGVRVIYHNHRWIEDLWPEFTKPQPELTPLAPSPWSPLAPAEPGEYWHWSGKRGEGSRLITLRMGPYQKIVVIKGNDSRFSPIASEIGGFWMLHEASALMPDRTSEILAQQLAKLEEQARILRHGYFIETAAVINGVVSTLRAAFEKGSK